MGLTSLFSSFIITDIFGRQRRRALSVVPLPSAFLIGIASGILVDLAVEILDMCFHVDDPVGAVAVHCVNGIWGTIAVGLFACNESYGTKGLFYGGGLRPELSYGSHFFQDLVESGIFYEALYQGQNDCLFEEEAWDAFPNRYRELTGDEKLQEVVWVLDLGEQAILYSEVKSQDCFLGLL